MASTLSGIIVASAVMLVLFVHVAVAQPNDWPSLRFHFTLKRSSMKVHGETDFSMYANPILSDSDDKVLYDVFASFTDDTTLYNYTLIDGAAYASTTPFSSSLSDKDKVTPSVDCVDSESGTLPAINAIVTAINKATAVSSVKGAGSDAISGFHCRKLFPER
ncbi:hypothetical protein GN244_ATG18735 [Phytophthora infestans]|uniref:Uncharacterized protein n=1 Tax=Phytophthora infestans TaxID=4787 RepID=A0A833SHD5_PHYIN|nr:hypothetical protein GN244_ATG18735 [Phytophthora infestans]KAF4131847.1 hypothetical protein GN958_ATG18880 [Phytophthora infestans]